MDDARKTLAVGAARLVVAADMDRIVGASFLYCDDLLRYGQRETGASTAVSTINIMKAWFTEVMGAKDMFRRIVQGLQDQRLLPQQKVG